MRVRGTGVWMGILVVTASGAWAQPAFRTARTATIFDGALSKAAADLDGDDRVDLLFPAGQGGTVSVFWGTPTGTFTEQFPTFETGIQPVAVAVGNFDEDPQGHADIATVDSGRISVLRGLGNREFDTAPVLTTADTISSPAALIATDVEGAPLYLNDDLHTDLVVANAEEQGSIAVFYGVGDGTFTAAGELAAQQGTGALVAADVDGNGTVDVIASNRNANSISVYLNQNSNLGEQMTFPAGDAPQGLAVGRWTQDAHLDVVVADRNRDAFALLAGDGTGRFAAPVEFSAGFQPADAAAADFDGDGYLDAVIANNLSQDVTVAYGDGRGGFPRRQQFLSDAGTVGVLAGWCYPGLILDANADTRPDVVAVNTVLQVASTYTVLLGAPDRLLIAAEDVPTRDRPSAIAIGDLDSDGRPDAAVATQTEAVSLIFSRPQGFVTGEVRVGGTSSGVTLADVNGDAHPDLAALLDDRVVVALGTGHGGFQTSQAVPIPPRNGDTQKTSGGIATGDLTEDGRVDIVVTGGDAGTVGILRGNGDGTFQPVTQLRLLPPGSTADVFPIALAVEDLDGDGHVDLAVASFVENGSVFLVYNQGDGTFGRCSATTASHCNADAECPSGETCATAGEVVQLPSGRRPLAIQATDLDANGILDLLTANQDTAGLLVHQATGARTYAAPLTFSSGEGTASALALRDVDGDGRRDALVTGRASDRVFIHRSRTTSPFFSRTATASCPNAGCLATGPQPVGIAAADMDDNGTYDVLSVNNFSGTVTANISTRAAVLLRGDANDDASVSAADLVAVITRLSVTHYRAIEDAVLAGQLQPPTLAADADGDGMLTVTDTVGVMARLFRD